jgi:hypothetical protein
VLLLLDSRSMTHIVFDRHKLDIYRRSIEYEYEYEYEHRFAEYEYEYE